MLKFDKLMQVLDGYAPLALSKLMIENGSYDNSGAIVKCGENVNKILFSLDLSKESVKKAIELKCDCIVTHHPAIYHPIKNLLIGTENQPLLDAIKGGISIISMHLNLDIADYGVDYWLAKALCDGEHKILSLTDNTHGYGREFKCEKDLLDLVECVKSSLGTQKVIAYGSGETKVVASFCGGGASHALEQVLTFGTSADTIITSDMAHHELKELIEKDKKVVIIPHYASEDYGFNKFYQSVIAKLGDAQTYYFQDKRFM